MSRARSTTAAMLLLPPFVATKPPFVTSKPPAAGLDGKSARQEAAAASVDPSALGAPCSSGMFHDSSVCRGSQSGPWHVAQGETEARLPAKRVRAELWSKAEAHRDAPSQPCD